MTELMQFFMLFVVFSMLGWMTEVVYAYYITKKFVNRGFLYGPFCPIYGAGLVGIYASMLFFNSKMLEGQQVNLLLTFVFVTLLTTTLEYITGYILEIIFHTKWWDYSDRKLNLKGYICLRFSILWGIVGTIMVRYVVPSVADVINSLPLAVLSTLSSAFLIYFIIDGTFTVIGLIDLRKVILEFENLSVQMVDEWRRIKAELDERFEFEIMEKVEAEFNARKTSLEETLKTTGEKISDEIRELKTQLEREIDERQTALRLEFDEKTPKYFIDARKKFNDELQERKQMVTSRLDEKRLYRAFPKMKIRKTPEKWEDIKKRIMEEKNRQMKKKS